jgi:hypothetical protein
MERKLQRSEFKFMNVICCHRDTGTQSQAYTVFRLSSKFDGHDNDNV